MMRRLFYRQLPLLLCLALLLSMSAMALEHPPEELIAVYPRYGGLSEEVAVPLELEDVPIRPADALPASAGTFEEAVCAGLAARAEVIDVSAYQIPADTGIQQFYFPLLYDHPEFFYVQTSCQYSYLGGCLYEIYPKYLDGLASPEAFNARVEEILAETVTPDMTDLEKALALHDYLVLNCAYDWNVGNGFSASSKTVYTAYGPLWEGNSVCQGYAMAYNLLLHSVGIEAEYLSSAEMNHGWSLVKVDGSWYHVDVTYDDPLYKSNGDVYGSDIPGLCGHSYFLLSTKTILASEHYGFEAGMGDIVCGSTAFESGYLFNGALSGFYPYEGAFRYLDGDASVRAVKDLTLMTDSVPANDYTGFRTQFRNGQCYIYQSYTNAVRIYQYDMDFDLWDTLKIMDAAPNCSIQLFPDGLYLVALPRSGPGVTKLEKLSRPASTGDNAFRATAFHSADGEAVPSRLNGSYIYLLSNTAQTCTVCLGLFDGSGRLLDLVWQQVELSANEKEKVVFNIENHPGAASARLLCLSDDFCPLLKPSVLD